MSMVEALIASQVAAAQSMAAAAREVLGTAVVPLASANFSSTASGGTTLTQSSGQQMTVGEPPAYSGSRFSPSAAPGMDTSMTPMPGMNISPPAKITSARPTYVSPPIPGDLPVFAELPSPIGSLTVPPPPDALCNINFVIPEVTQISVPPTPDVELPEFAATQPDILLDDPGDLSAPYEGDYTNANTTMRTVLDQGITQYLNKINPKFDAQMAAIEAQLEKYLAGGTGLNQNVEQALFNRARDKSNGEYLKTRDTIWKDGSARGFTIPGGAQFSALAQARQAAADNNARAALEIAIKQGEMEQANLQFAVTQSANLRSVALNASMAMCGYLIQANGQAIQYAQGILQAVIATYETKVKIAQAHVAVYQAEAQVYETRLKAALSVYEVYRAQIEGLKSQVDCERAVIDAFSARMQGYAALTSTYRAQIEGVAAMASVEKIKAEIYGMQVQAYSAKVGAKQAEWQAFTAQVNGQTAQAEVYKAEVATYVADVGGYEALIRAKQAEIQAVAATNEGKARMATAGIEAYRAGVAAESEAVQAEIRSFEASIHAFSAKASAVDAQGRLDLARLQGEMEIALKQRSLEESTRMTEAKLLTDQLQNHAQVAVSAGQVYAHMAGTMAAGITALASASEVTNI